MDINITHISHSGFILETEDLLMVFDYYKGDINLKDKKTIVFVTHGHGDHYTDEIFQWAKGRKSSIEYVLSSDIDLHVEFQDIHVMETYEHLNLGEVSVKSFGSTDLGLSFLINYKSINIFYAGDLNWWHWENDSQEEKIDMETQFKLEIEKIKLQIKERNANIDIVFFPVDPRLEDNFSLGAEYFIKQLNPNYLIPMHFGDKFDTSKKFINKIGNIGTNIVDINKENQTINIEINKY